MTRDSLAVAISLLAPGRVLLRDAMRTAILTVMSVVKTPDVVATAGPTPQTMATATLETPRTVGRTMVTLKQSV
jgi:hypothetical protein